MTALLKKLNTPDTLTVDDLTALLQAEGDTRLALLRKSEQVRNETVGRAVYYRGLIEFSNICSKDCYYCGIRAGNTRPERYELDADVILAAIRYAHDNRFASVVLQAGERTGPDFTDRVTRLLKRARELTGDELRITLSLGEQPEHVFQDWYNAGARRYLLRMETTNRELYRRLHPDNDKHSYDIRLEALHILKRIGYQTGSGVMIGLPGQTAEDLARDLLFLRDFDIDMVGMGSYLEHEETPLYKQRHTLLPTEQRFDLTLKMIALLRIMMPSINIAATTAMQTIDPQGREKAIKVGANVIMPNITPTEVRKQYQLYNDKPCLDERPDQCGGCLEGRVAIGGGLVAYGEWGDSLHFRNRTADQAPQGE